MGGFHGTQDLFFRLSHFKTAIFLVDNFCNCLNSSYASFGEKNEIGRVVFDLFCICYHGNAGKIDLPLKSPRIELSKFYFSNVNVFMISQFH